MWFLNKKTGLKWEITDKELIKRLKNNENYEEVKQTQTAKKTTTPKKK